MDFSLQTLATVWGLIQPFWQLILGFLAGCWFYRYLLKKNPTRLQALVDIVNSTGKAAEAAVSKVVDEAKPVPPTK